MARTGMADLIAQVRANAAAGTADYTIGGVTYWTDDQIQGELDATRSDVKILLSRALTYEGGTATYKDYYFGADVPMEQATSGAEAWEVQDSSGAAIGTSSYSVNYRAGHIRFSADTTGALYYLRGRVYDVEDASARVWERKAAHYASRYDVVTDNHNLKRSQLHTQALQMARYWRSQVSPRSVEWNRMDYADLG